MNVWLFVETRWSDNNVGLLHLVCSKMGGCRLRGGVLEDKCSCRICGQLVADSGGDANLLARLECAGCWKRCFCGKCQLTWYRIWIMEISSWRMAPKCVQRIKGFAEVDTGKVEVDAVLLKDSLEGC